MSGERAARESNGEQQAAARGRPGSPQRLTSRDVALVAGVSQSTVSNVLNRPDLVAEATRARVLAAIESTGFVVNRSARTLRAGRGSTLGVVVLDVANPYWGELTRGVEATAAAAGQAVIVGSSDESAEKEEVLLRLLEEQQVRGILVAPVAMNLLTLEAIRSRGTDVVLVDRNDPTLRFPSVSADHVHGAFLAGQHLIAVGHRRVAFINGPQSVPWCRDRAEGFSRAFQAAGLDPATCVREITVPAMTARAGEGSVGTLLELPTPVSGVFCANDMLALGVLKGLGRRGVRVPTDVSLVGYDDDNFAELLSPGLTTVRQDPYAIGERAAQLILGTGKRESVTFSPVLVVRDSVAAVSGALVVTAVSSSGVMPRRASGLAGRVRRVV